ncbi:hypothetical protein CCAX7_29900 [Capsulimonas corticalis]|uniref:Uncharacterized protein n=1 Tax=Capsulimonas corticalis TaxID=2219043 RepID=A0A402CSX9_9BACT|nr:hypothetical protein [Capsulimonas corticalis]BDI30939.1 hypothetical protein CCAX7_29900 [Capsulimonas corticalis]
MTLIAAYRSYGIPVLMGDLLITGGGMSDDYRRKICRFSPHFVVAWTGHLILAEIIFTEIRRKMVNHSLTKEWLESVLTSYQVEDFGLLSIRLVGWIIDQGENCFRWNSEYPSELFYGEPMLDGTGAPFIDGFVGQGNIYDMEYPEAIDLEKAKEHCLFLATNLMSEEILKPGSTQSYGFGYAYEMLCLTESGFQYIDELMYFVLTVKFDCNWKFESASIENPMYTYSQQNEYAIIHKLNREGESDLSIIAFPGSSTDLSEGNDLVKKYANAFVNKNIAIPNVYCIFLNYIGVNYRGPLFSMLVNSDDMEASPIKIVRGSQGKMQVILHQGTLEEFYRDIRSDQEL